MDRLDEMLLQQYMLQRHIYGYDIEDQTLTQRVANLKVNVFALEHELHELIDETSWKEWAKVESYINYDEARKEAIDALHFLMNIFLHLGMSGSDVFEAYVRKNQINHQRQDNGYDGLATKCPQCQRALDDVLLREVVSPGVGQVPGHVIVYCPCGREIARRLA